MRRAIICIALAAVLAVPVAAFAQGAAPVLKPDLPVDVLAVIEVGSLNSLQANLQAFASAVTPAAALPPLQVLLSKMTKSANPMAMDASRPIRIVFVKTAQGVSPPVAVFSTTSAQAFKTGLMPNLKQTAQEGNITLYEEQGNKPVAIGMAGTRVCISSDKAAVAIALGLVNSGKLTDRPLLARTDQVAAYLRVSDMLAHFTKTTGSSPFNMLRSLMMQKMTPPGQPGQPGTAAFGAAMSRQQMAQIDALEAISNQVESLYIGLSPNAQQLGLTFAVEARANSNLANYFASVPSGLPETMGYLPKDAFMAAGFKVGDIVPLMTWAADFQRKMMAAAGEDAATIEETIHSLQEMALLYGDEQAFAMRPGKGLCIVQVRRFVNAEAAKAVAAKVPLLTNKLTRMYQKMGINMQIAPKPVPLSHKGHEISEWKMSFDVTPPEGADAQANAIAAQQRRVFQAMFGNVLTFHAATIGRDWVITTGATSLESLKAIIASSHAKLTDDATFQSARASLPPQSNGIAYIRLTGLMPWALSLARNMSGGRMMIPIPPNVEFQPGPGIVAGLDFTGSRVVCSIRIPAAEIKSVVDGIQKAMMSAAGPGAQPGMTAPQPVPEVQPMPR